MSEVAVTILKQLGGRRFLTMTGAKNLVADDQSLMMELPATLTKNRINRLRVALDPSDTYTVETFIYRKLTLKSVEKQVGIYCDMLQQTFTRMTGLDTRL